MGFGLKRSDLQAIAQAKLDDAVLLFEQSRYSNAYYLAGYAVEIGLKACVARQIVAEAIPDKEVIKNILSHEFDKLIGLSGLKVDLKWELTNNADFAANWALVKEWTPDARYVTHDKTKAQVMIMAVGDRVAGIFQWIKRHW